MEKQLLSDDPSSKRDNFNIQLSNTHNIPISMAVFLAGDNYDGYSKDPFNISVSTLLKSTRQIILYRRLPDNLVKDISENIKSRLGQAYHQAIEDSWLDNNLPTTLKKLGVNERLRNRIKVNPILEEVTEDCVPCYFELRNEIKIGNWTVTGKFDQVINGTLEDNKSTSVYTLINQTNDEKYQKQGSMYRWLNPNIVTEDYMVINFIFTDWSGGRARTDKSGKYPKLPIHWKKFPLASIKETDQFVRNKLKEIERYLHKPEPELPLCSDDDLWRKPASYKYYSKPTNKKASKVFDNKWDAGAHALEKGGHVVVSPGEVTACKYCAAFSICTQKDQYIQDGSLKL